MKHWKGLLTRLRSLFTKNKLDSEMDEEMRAHIELRTQANIDAGLSPREARFAALRQFGPADSVKEACRDQRGIRWLETTAQDLRHGWRGLRKNPGFALVTMLTLALGIGAVTTQFSLLHGALWGGAPFPAADRLFHLALRNPAWPPDRTAAPCSADFLEWQRLSRTCSGLAASDSSRWLNVSIAGKAIPLGGAFVTHNFFSLLGVRPVLGRDFAPEDDRPGAPGVALISHALWLNEFGGRPDAIGRALRLEGRMATVIGVMPPGCSFPAHEKIWATFFPSLAETPARDRIVHVVGRLQDGASWEQAGREFTAIAQRLAREFPVTNRELTAAQIDPLPHSLAGELRDPLWALLAAAAGVLVIACVNVMNLQFARAVARAHELALRGALGASRARLLRQMVTEGLLLATGGGVLGVLFAHWASRLFRNALGGLRFGGLPGWVVTDLNLTVLGFTLAATVAAVLLSSVAPALFASRADAMSLLKQGGRGQSNRLVNTLGQGLVVAQISLASALLVVSLLQFKSIARHAGLDLGFRADGVMAGRMSLANGYPSPADRARFYRQFLVTTRANPEFTHVALTTRPLAMMGGWDGRVELESDPGKPTKPIALEYVSDAYFATLGLTPREGREFESGETARGGFPVLVNVTFARSHFGGASALGRRLRGWREAESPAAPRAPGAQGEWHTIVGVVPDTRLQGPFDPRRDGAGVFFPIEESLPPYPTVVVRGRARAETLAGPLRNAVNRVDQDLTLYGLGTPRANLLASNGQARVVAALCSVFAALAGLLAAVGIYGVTSFTVNQRQRDFGIRLALGSDARGIMGLVLRLGARQFLLGATGGLALALALGRVGGTAFEDFLFQVSPRDPAVYLATLGLLAVATGLACLFPARRAARVDPMVVLRSE